MMSEFSPKQLANEMPFAKIVILPYGEEGLLIAGRVYSVFGPDGNAAGLFSKAMRLDRTCNQPETNVASMG
jgi:hypothetical protein